jgi:hypothetical protein
VRQPCQRTGISRQKDGNQTPKFLVSPLSWDIWLIICDCIKILQYIRKDNSMSKAIHKISTMKRKDSHRSFLKLLTLLINFLHVHAQDCAREEEIPSCQLPSGKAAICVAISQWIFRRITLSVLVVW